MCEKPGSAWPTSSIDLKRTACPMAIAIPLSRW